MITLYFPMRKHKLSIGLLAHSSCAPGSIFEALQGFDEEFFMYHEDTDICYRAAQQGKKFIFLLMRQ